MSAWAWVAMAAVGVGCLCLGYAAGVRSTVRSVETRFAQLREDVAAHSDGDPAVDPGRGWRARRDFPDE